jgi:hypothetical protein
MKSHDVVMLGRRMAIIPHSGKGRGTEVSTGGSAERRQGEWAGNLDSRKIKEHEGAVRGSGVE